MPATEENKLEQGPVRHLGIIAGGGILPERLLAACDQKDIDVFIVGFDGQTDPALMQGRNHVWTRLGAVGQVLSALRTHQVRDLVLIGSIRRPSFSELVPDLKAMEFFTRVGFKSLGDNDFLGAIRGFLEKEGFIIHGVHKFAEDLLAPEGPVGKHKPKGADWSDITRGFAVAQTLGAADVGQSVIVQEGLVLGVEAIEGTDELIRRCRPLQRKGRGAILVKMRKPQQDRDLDMPTIGPGTVRLAAECGMAGIAVEAGQSLLIDLEEVAEIADQHKMFVTGVDPGKI